jgi:hypothetical protein
MIAGGLFLTVAGLTLGEARTLGMTKVSPRSALAMAYLIMFADGIHAYNWMLTHVLQCGFGLMRT